jgi:hypothetical protein
MTLEEKQIRAEAMREIARELVRMRSESSVPFRFGFCYDRKTALFDAASFVYDKAQQELGK